MIFGLGMFWKLLINILEGIGIVEEFVLNILSICMIGLFYIVLFIGKFCCLCEYDI